MSGTPRFPAIMGPRRDLAWFVAPGVLTAIAAVLIGVLDPGPRDAPVLLWIVGVLLIDVAHVYASLYRTYLDPEARRLHRKRLIVVPLLCAWFGILLHLESPLLFWSVLAYVAIFHFIKQHVGFALLYVRAGGETALDRRLTGWAIWAGTAGPVVYWHAHLPRHFAWFMDGDLVSGLPPAVGSFALWATLPIWLAFAVRRIALARAGRLNPMVPLLVVVPALNWYLGIVVFDDDRIFTLTNVVGHGIPYMALVFVAGGRDTVAARVHRISERALAGVVAVFYVVLVALALLEELLWDRLVWHDQPQLFGASEPGFEPDSLLAAIVVSLLTVPQATHYVLDRFIWRVGPENPRLAAQLGLQR